MRYYRVIISDPKTQTILIPNYNGTPGFSRVLKNDSLDTYTSLYPGGLPTQFGSTNPAAQRVVLDIPVSYLDSPGQNAYLRVYGIGLKEIAQASNLTNLNIEVYGGMAAGLPLANPAQAGKLVSAQIWNAFGNWINTEMTLDIYLYYGGSSPSSAATTNTPNSNINNTLPSTLDTPANIVFNWKSGQTLIAALVNTLSQAFPQYAINGQISPNLVRQGAADIGYFSTLRQFAYYIRQKSTSIINGYQPTTIPTANNYYSGVRIVLQNGAFLITDSTYVPQAKLINFPDLIGQPTWTAPFTVQTTCVMRSDIKVGDFIVLPPGLGTIESGASSSIPGAQNFYSADTINTYAQSRQQSIFSGTFQVLDVRHVGDHRADDATGWVTLLEMQQQIGSGSPNIAGYTQISDAQ